MRSRKTITLFAALAAAVLFGGAATAVADPATPAPAPASPAPDAPAPAVPTISGDGTYQVGTDIAPGTYTSGGPQGDSACYWKRVSGDNIVANAMTKKPQTVRIDPTDTTFVSSHCQSWQPADCSAGCPSTGPSPQEVLGILGGFINARPAPAP